MAGCKLYTHEEMLDAVVGMKGTPRRDKYEADIHNFLIEEASKHLNLMQEQWGERMGVKKATLPRPGNM